MAKSYQNNTELVFNPGTTVSFDEEAFDTSLRSQGVRLTHYRSMKCPVGMIDKDDIRRPHDDHEGCSNGFIYLKSGEITGIFTGNSNDLRQIDLGLLDGSTVKCTFPRFYDETDIPVEVTPFDRLYLIDEAITVPNWELVEAHITGKDRLRFPATCVSDLIDSSGQKYNSSDYTIEKGQIVWNPGKGPGFDANTNKGRVYSIRYFYKPFWYVSRVLHQVRIAQVETPLERKTIRMPHEMLLQREYVSMNEDNDDQAKDPNSNRQVRGPRKYEMGPR